MKVNKVQLVNVEGGSEKVRIRYAPLGESLTLWADFSIGALGVADLTEVVKKSLHTSGGDAKGILEGSVEKVVGGYIVEFSSTLSCDEPLFFFMASKG